MKIIGITGGIGSGKSRVLSHMQEKYHARILQTDLVAHQLQEPGKPCYDKILLTFGKEILKENDKIDRKKLGNLVFSDPEKLQLLNDMIHPAVKTFVREEIEKAEKEGAPLFLVESALLREDHYEEICDELWYIFAAEDVRIRRLMEVRGLEIEKIQRIMDSQAEEEVFRNYCDVTIDNSGSFEKTEEQIAEAMKEINRR